MVRDRDQRRYDLRLRTAHHQAPYVQFNAGIFRQFSMPDGKPVTLRFDVVNLLDTIYELRNGNGIGVFAPQFGPRRGFFFGISKKI